jgi:hypothetical protein
VLVISSNKHFIPPQYNTKTKTVNYLLECTRMIMLQNGATEGAVMFAEQGNDNQKKVIIITEAKFTTFI